MPSLIPESIRARRFVYELVYAWLGAWHAKAFNIGLAPVDPAILFDPALAGDSHQIQLYAELFSLAGRDVEEWRQSAVLEVAAGCGGGLLYLSRHHQPRLAVGIDCQPSPHAGEGVWASISAKLTRTACRSRMALSIVSSASMP